MSAYEWRRAILKTFVQNTDRNRATWKLRVNKQWRGCRARLKQHKHAFEITVQFNCTQFSVSRLKGCSKWHLSSLMIGATLTLGPGGVAFCCALNEKSAIWPSCSIPHVYYSLLSGKPAAPAAALHLYVFPLLYHIFFLYYRLSDKQQPISSF